MKKIESLGKSLSKAEQKKIMGGDEEEVGGSKCVTCLDPASGTMCGPTTCEYSHDEHCLICNAVTHCC